jgi:hypothetical protein
MYCILSIFELCWLPQRPSLTLHPLGGSTPRMWPLFLMRAKGKRKEMTGTQHVGTLKHQFLQYVTIKNVFVLFPYRNNFKINYSSAIWWRHLPAACNNFFEAGVSGNSDRSKHMTLILILICTNRVLPVKVRVVSDEAKNRRL